MLSLLCASWVVWIVAAVVVNGTLHWKACFPQLIQDVLSYGKIKLDQSNVFLRVPKRSYKLLCAPVINLFYIIGGLAIFTYGALFGTPCCSSISLTAASSNRL